MTDALMHAMSRSPFADARMQALASTGVGTPPGCQKSEKKNETALEGGPDFELNLSQHTVQNNALPPKFLSPGGSFFSAFLFFNIVKNDLEGRPRSIF